MPKVIGQDESIYKRITCRHCGAINEYLPNEVRVLYKGRDMDGGYSETLGFSCAKCSDHVITKSS